MIPTAIFLGLIGGLTPRYRWWAVPIIGVVWSLVLTVGGDPSMSFAQIWIGGFVLGAINGAVGVSFTRGVEKAILVVFRWARGWSVSS